MRIRAYASLRETVGSAVLDRETPDAKTVGDVLALLAATYPGLTEKLWDAQRKSTGYVTVLLNGRAIEYMQGEATPISPEDTLSLFPPVGGG